jgi:hypothetical protein
MKNSTAMLNLAGWFMKFGIESWSIILLACGINYTLLSLRNNQRYNYMLRQDTALPLGDLRLYGNGE